MFRPSVIIPEAIRKVFNGDLENQNIARIPVTLRQDCPYLFFDPVLFPTYRLRVNRTGEYEKQLIGGSVNYHRVPAPGKLCWLVIDNGR